MNTTKQINVMVLMVFLAVFVTGAYWLWDPSRADTAKDDQLKAKIERGAWTFSQNCRVCHGNVGEGGAASNRLRSAPALNRPDLQGKNADGVVDKTAKEIAYKLIINTITCGRVGKAMPTWGQAQGGTLNDEQIRQLATLITEGTGWEVAEEFAIEGVPAFDKHGDDGDGLSLAAAVSEDDATITLNRVPDALAEGLRLQIGEEILLIQSVDQGASTVTVERAVGTTLAEAHDAGAQVLRPPVPPSDPVPTVQAACGQTAQIQQTLPPEDPSTTLSITAEGTAWNKVFLSAIAGEPLTISVDNKDAGTGHNIHFTIGAEPGGDEFDPPLMTDIENGPVVQTLNFGPLDAGEYYYVCDVHPAMEGVLTAYAPGTGPNTTPEAEATPEP